MSQAGEAGPADPLPRPRRRCVQPCAHDPVVGRSIGCRPVWPGAAAWTMSGSKRWSKGAELVASTPHSNLLPRTGHCLWTIAPCTQPWERGTGCTAEQRRQKPPPSRISHTADSRAAVNNLLSLAWASSVPDLPQQLVLWPAHAAAKRWASQRSRTGLPFRRTWRHPCSQLVHARNAQMCATLASASTTCA